MKETAGGGGKGEGGGYDRRARDDHRHSQKTAERKTSRKLS